MEKHVFRQDDAYHKFGTGNYRTLWEAPRAAGRDPRKQLIEWWEKWYCARRMKLAIVGKESTEELERWAREKFAKVPIRSEGAPAVGEEGVRVVFDSSPMGEKQMGVSCFAQDVWSGIRDMPADGIDDHICSTCQGQSRTGNHFPLP